MAKKKNSRELDELQVSLLDDKNFLKGIIETFCQRLPEEEITHHLQARAYQRSEKALVVSLMEMYINGVSTRKVADITEKLCGINFSKSQVSDLSKELDEEIAAWSNRPLEKNYPYLVVDARYEKVRKQESLCPEYSGILGKED